MIIFSNFFSLCFYSCFLLICCTFCLKLKTVYLREWKVMIIPFLTIMASPLWSVKYLLCSWTVQLRFPPMSLRCAWSRMFPSIWVGSFMSCSKLFSLRYLLVGFEEELRWQKLKSPATNWGLSLSMRSSIFWLSIPKLPWCEW